MAQATRTVVLSGTLEDSAGNGLTEPLTATYISTASGSTAQPFGSTTSSAGSWSISGSVPAPGNYIFTVSFAGVSGQYDPSSASTPATQVNAKVVLTIQVTVQ